MFLRTPSLLRFVNPLVVFISEQQSFKKCSRAAQNALEGRMRPAGRNLPTPVLGDVIWPFNFLCCITILSSSVHSVLIVLHILRLFIGSGYFAVDGNLPSETILP